MLDQYIGHWPLIQKRGHVLVYVNTGVILRMCLEPQCLNSAALCEPASNEIPTHIRC